MTMPVDAIPDLSENQVIVFTDWMGRSPQEIEDQVTYPLSVNLQGLAGVHAGSACTRRRRSTKCASSWSMIPGSRRGCTASTR